MLYAFVLSILAGWFGHKLKVPTARIFTDEATNRLVSYAEGSLLVFLAFALLTAGKIDKTSRETALSQLLVAMLGVGLGTTAGTIVDFVRGR